MKSQEMNHTLTIVNKWDQCVTFSYTTRGRRELLSYPHLRRRRERRRSNNYSPEKRYIHLLLFTLPLKGKKYAHTHVKYARVRIS